MSEQLVVNLMKALHSISSPLAILRLCWAATFHLRTRHNGISNLDSIFYPYNHASIVCMLFKRALLSPCTYLYGRERRSSTGGSRRSTALVTIYAAGESRAVVCSIQSHAFCRRMRNRVMARIVYVSRVSSLPRPNFVLGAAIVQTEPVRHWLSRRTGSNFVMSMEGCDAAILIPRVLG